MTSADRGKAAPAAAPRSSHANYARQLWDAKASAPIEEMDGTQLRHYGEVCGWTLARAHARTGDREAIAADLDR